MRPGRLIMVGLLVVAAAGAAGAAAGVSGRGEARWVIRDLGTLGGAASEAQGISERGQVVGWSDVRSGARGQGLHRAFVWARGRMRSLGTPRGTESEANAVNSLGVVAGRFKARGEWRAVVWQAGRLHALAGRFSAAMAINERGQVVGWAGSPDHRAALWIGSRLTDLGRLGGTTGFAWDINTRGEIVGGSEVDDGDVDGNFQHAFRWQNGAMHDLGAALGGHDSSATAVNDRGQIVGWAETRARWKNPLGMTTNVTHAVRWLNGKTTDLGTLGGPQSQASGVNLGGQVVGWADTRREHATGPLAGWPIIHAFVWDQGRMVDLGGLIGGTHSQATAINNQGQIVGWATTKTGQRHAVLWTKTG